MVEFSEKLIALICERMAKGETLADICRKKGMPPASTVRTWAVQDRGGCHALYARAREMQMEAWADEIVAISADSSQDTHTTTYGDGSERTSPNTEWISRSRLRVDTLKWLMSKVAPKRYGERLEVDQKTVIGIDNTVEALMERIGQGGKRIHDK